MSWLSLLGRSRGDSKRLARRSAKALRRPSDARFRRLRVEPLEDRCLLSVAAESLGVPLAEPASSGPGGTAIYANDFEGAIDDEWSSTLVDVTPAGARRFLGQFGSEAVTLSLPAALVPAGTKALALAFDVYVIRTWDGNHTVSGSGPDRWSVSLGNGVALLDTTFSNNHPNSGFAGQAYPGPFGTAQNSPMTGADEINTLGYEYGGQLMDSVYNLDFTFTYTGGDVVLTFAGDLTTPGFDESWGLDNVRVTAIAEAYSAPNDFALTNPNGPWSYGWMRPSDLAYGLYFDLSTLADGTQYMTDNAIQSLGAPSVTYNPTASATLGDLFPLLPGQLGMHPGPNGEWSVVRWTAPATETVTLAALFTGRDTEDPPPATTTDVYVIYNSLSTLFAGTVNRFRVGPYFQTTLDMQSGDTIDFVVGDGGNGFISDSTALDAVILADSAGPPPPPPVFQFTASQYQVSEGQQVAVVQVERTGGLDQAARVEFTTVDGTAASASLRTPRALADYTATSGTLVFRAQQSVAEVRIPIRDDSRREPDETFQIVLGNPSPGAELGPLATAGVVIHDNDPAVSFLAATSATAEVSAIRWIAVGLSVPSNTAVTVAYAAVGGTATFGSDFRTLAGTLTFRPGETRKFLPLQIVSDTAYEGNETVLLELSSPSNAFLGATVRHTVTIADNDPPPPPADPGPNAATALAIDLATLPIQSYQEFLSRGDVDVFRVQLHGGEYLALDVDPGRGPVLPSSRLAIVDADGTTVLAMVGASAEPETGQVTNNPAYLFQADADGGTYYIALWTGAPGAVFGYTLRFFRTGVSENVPPPGLLNVPGPMFAWFDGEDTVGITGPTGYGFTLEGPWEQQTVTNRSGLVRQTLSLPTGSQFTLRSPQGLALPLVANGPINIRTTANRFGNVIGVVTSTLPKNAIALPVALDIVPINNLLADVFGSSFATVGLLSGQWRISLGGDEFNVLGTAFEATEKIDQLLRGVPYLRRFDGSLVDARLGGLSINYFVQPTPMHWIFDPADPMLFVKVPPVLAGPVDKAELAVSKHGLLTFKPQDPPSAGVDAGVTEFAGHVYGNTKLAFMIGPVPVELEADVVLNVDADRDGHLLGDLRDVADVFDILQGDFSELGEILHDIQLGANGGLTVAVPPKKPGGKPGPKMEAGRASLVLNGPAETVWVRGQQGGKAFPDSPIEIASASIVMEGLIDFGGRFLIIQTATQRAAGIELGYQFTISNEGISARIFGRAEWSVKINYGAGQVSGKAIAEIEADVAIEIDDDREVHLSGSIDASGKLRWNGNTLFSGSIDASVHSRGFRLRFPRGVGSLDLDLF